jgi:hypothetical protein
MNAGFLGIINKFLDGFGVSVMSGLMHVFIIVCLLIMGCAAGPRGKGTGSGKAVKVHQPGESRDECLRSIRRARNDARGGVYRLYLYRDERHDARFSRFLIEYLQARYGIELVMYGDDDAVARDRCYSNEMEKIIMNTFGPGILNEAEQEAREIFSPSER